ncbi:hypothetical protein ABZ370_24525 [Streptomyces sp. NPDC005962]|uniref:purine-cytosine permease family protein n=1 Tax=Streptomyces sp. NPDC005962 TaxID=3154466 RepID=UPI0033EB57F1
MTSPVSDSAGAVGGGWNERREDYALRRVPLSYRQWGAISLTGVMLGVATAMFFLAWGGQLIIAYGTVNTLIGMIFGTVLIGGVGLVLTRISAATGLDSDLITRGAGFGFMGSAFTSLIYTFNFVMFFAFEGEIMAAAIHDYWPVIPSWSVYLAVGLVFIPLTWWGITAMNWLMWATLPVYLGFLVWTIVLAATSDTHAAFWSHVPTTVANPAAGPALLQVMAASLGLISMATGAADLGRFLPPGKRTGGAVALGFGSMFVTLCVLTMLGGWFTLRFDGSTNPGAYLSGLMGIWGVLFVIVTQLRINTTNVYSGSLAYANFFCRIFHITPGRQYWVILTTVVGTGLMFGGILDHLNAILTFEATFIMAWVMAVVSDIVINKRLGLSPSNFVYKRAHTYKYNPVGVGALVFALAIALPLAFNVAGPLGKTLAPFVSGIVAFAAAPAIAALTRGRYYLPATAASNIDPALPAVGTGSIANIASARADAHTQEVNGTSRCTTCADSFELAEFVSCPFHQGPVCSVCCSSESRCKEMCKSEQQAVLTIKSAPTQSA